MSLADNGRWKIADQQKRAERRDQLREDRRQERRNQQLRELERRQRLKPGTLKIITEFSGMPLFPDDYLGHKPNAETRALLTDIEGVIAQYQGRPTPMALGIRGVGYIVINTIGGYGEKNDAWFDKVEKAIQYLRLNGRIPWDAIVDESRAIDGGNFWDSAAQLMRASSRQFKMDPWRLQDNAVLVGAEKHGLAGILREVTLPLCVPLATLGGVSSDTFAHDIAMWVAEHRDQDVHILYLGDYDPTGVQIPEWLFRDIIGTAQSDQETDLSCVADKARDGTLRIHRLALNNVAQAKTYGAVLRPLEFEKWKDNPHAVSCNWPLAEPVCEVDSIPVDAMQRLVRDAIENLRDVRRWEQARELEAAQRAAIDRAIKRMR